MKFGKGAGAFEELVEREIANKIKAELEARDAAEARLTRLTEQQEGSLSKAEKLEEEAATLRTKAVQDAGNETSDPAAMLRKARDLQVEAELLREFADGLYDTILPAREELDEAQHKLNVAHGVKLSAVREIVSNKEVSPLFEEVLRIMETWSTAVHDQAKSLRIESLTGFQTRPRINESILTWERKNGLLEMVRLS